MVLLRHDLPDGSWHYDWLLEPASAAAAPVGPDARVLLAFRVANRLDAGPPREFPAERLPDHRRLYLDYEGEIAGGRGRVTRVAAGTCRTGGVVIGDTPRALPAEAGWASATIDIHAQFLPGIEWHFRGTKLGGGPDNLYQFVFLGAL